MENTVDQSGDGMFLDFLAESFLTDGQANLLDSNLLEEPLQLPSANLRPEDILLRSVVRSRLDWRPCAHSTRGMHSAASSCCAAVIWGVPQCHCCSAVTTTHAIFLPDVPFGLSEQPLLLFLRNTARQSGEASHMTNRLVYA